MLTSKVLEERMSPINGKIKVVRTLGLGTYIQVEGLTQSGGIIESMWKGTLKKINKKEIKNCLILGLGGGTVAKLIGKHWPKANITGVDIDPVMVELGKRYLGLGGNSINVVIGDAYKYLTQNGKIKTKSYNLVIVDLYCGYEYPKKFEKEDFLKLIFKLLSPEGVVIFNRLYSGGKRKEAIKFGEKLESIFSEVVWHYPLANLMFICSK